MEIDQKKEQLLVAELLKAQEEFSKLKGQLAFAEKAAESKLRRTAGRRVNSIGELRGSETPLIEALRECHRKLYVIQRLLREERARKNKSGSD